MTEVEAIALIEATLPSLDAQQAQTLAEFAQSLAHPLVPLHLTDADRAGIAEARADFAAGRTYTSTEARAITAVHFTKLRGAASGV